MGYPRYLRYRQTPSKTMDNTSDTSIITSQTLRGIIPASMMQHDNTAQFRPEYANTSVITNATTENPLLNFSTEIDPSKEETMSPHDTTKFVLHGVLLCIVGVLGLVGNISGTLTFFRLQRPLKFHWLMIVLFTFDTLFITAAFILFAMPQISQDYKDGPHNYVGVQILPFIQISMTGSIYAQVSESIL